MEQLKRFDRIDIHEAFQGFWRLGLSPSEISSAMEGVRDAVPRGMMMNVDKRLFDNVIIMLKDWGPKSESWFKVNGWIPSAKR